MSTYTVASAENTTATNLHVVDTVANILGALSNNSLLARVSLFSMSGNAIVTAMQSAELAALGSQFSTNGHTLTIRDTVANLTATGNAAGPSITGATVDVVDTAANILAADGNPIISHASAIALTANATLSLANLLILERFPSFTAVGVTLTLADTAANLLAFTAAEAKPALTVFTLNASGSVGVTQAITLAGLSHFSVQAGATLTVSGAIGTIAGSAASLSPLLAMSGVAVNFSDTLSNLLAQASTFSWYKYPGVSVTLSSGGQATAANLITLAGLPHFSVAAGVTLTVADTVQNLTALNTPEAALANAIYLSGNGTATAAQLAVLASFSNFTPGTGNTLTLDDTVADIAGVTAHQQALVSSVTIDDTVTDLLTAASLHPTVVAEATKIVAELDGTTLNAAQAMTLAALAAHGLTLQPNGSATALTISDTPAAISAAQSSINILEADGPGLVTVIPETNADRTILTANAAAALVQSGGTPATETLAVADSGAALTQYASLIFGEGFETITVTTGSFAGTMAQLLDPTLHFAAGATAQLDASAATNVAQAAALATLPGFNRADGVTLTVHDSISNILAAAATLGAVATSILASDAGTVSLAGAETLATLAGFSLNGNSLTIQDTAANLAPAVASGPSAAIALASSVELASDARISATVATHFAALGSKFSPDGFSVLIVDSVDALYALASVATTLQTVNSWGGEAELAANDIASVAQATTIDAIVGFNPGPYHLTLRDSGDNLLEAGSAVLALAYTVQLSQASTVTAANAATLAAMHDFSANGFLTIMDTPADLAGMATSLAGIASSVTLAAETMGNSPAFTITAAQFVALMALPNLSFAGFAGTVTVNDTAAHLAYLAARFMDLSGTVQADFATTLNGPATVTAAMATILHGLPGFSVNENSLTISDTASNLAGLGSLTAAMASAIQLQDGATATVTTYQKISALPHFSTNGNTLIISDTESRLLDLASGTDLSFASAIVLSAPALDIFAATAEQLASLPNFTVGSSGYITISDNATDLTAGSGALPNDWAGELAAQSVTLNSTGAAITAAQADDLAALGSRFSTGSYTLTVSDSAANLLSHANAAGVALAGAVTLAGDETALTAANWALLQALPDFSKGGYTVTISDTAAALAAASPSLLAQADHVQLSTPAALTVAAAEALVGLANYQPGATLTISDTLSNLLLLADANLANNNTILAATPIELSTDAIASVAQVEALETLTQYGSFDLNGNTITVEDSGKNLADFTPSGNAIPIAYVMVGDATVTVAQAQVLANENVSIGNNTLTVQGTYAQLESLPSQILSIATLEVTGSGSTLTATEAASIAQTLHATPLPGLIVEDTIANLTNIGGWESIATGGYIVADSAGNLIANASSPLLANDAVGLDRVVLTSDAQVDTGQFATLAAIPLFSRGAVTLTVTGSTLAIANEAAQIATLASSAVANSTVPVAAAQAEALGVLSDNGVLSFSGGIELTIQDSFANITEAANAAGLALASSVTVVDTPAELVVAAAYNWGSLTPNFELNAGGSVNGAGAAALYALGARYTPLSYTVTVDDTASGVLDNTTAIEALGLKAEVQDSLAGVDSELAGLLALGSTLTSVTLTDVSPVGAAAAAEVAPLAAKLTGTTIAVADTAAAIAGAVAGLTTLLNAGVLGAVSAANQTAAAVATNGAALESLHGTATISDSAAGVSAQLAALDPLVTDGVLTAITLTDSGTPAIALSLNQVTTDAAVLDLIKTSFSYAITDTAAAVSAGLDALEPWAIEGVL
ncbi:MAG TPA: hypothetical protein VME47_00755, partial [Acetobacteraceae bacterium]|nr:hypothetical protein [Acetobacteraceae bacterium]